MHEIPHWIQVFVLVGIGLVVVLVPFRVVFELTRGARQRTRRQKDLADRMKERFGAVRFERGLLGPHRIHFSHEGRPATLVEPAPEQLVLRLEPRFPPKFDVVAATRGGIAWPLAVMWESCKILPRIRTLDPILDDRVDLFAAPAFAPYLRELLQSGASDPTRPSGLAESLVVLGRMPGVRRFELRVSPMGGFRVTFQLRAEDLLYRPDELESALHHAFQIYDLLVLR
jgi:hypothetical protein